MKSEELDLKRVTMERVGTCTDFFRIYIDGKHFGYLAREPVNGYEAYCGTNWPESKLIGRSFNLSKLKSWSLMHYIDRMESQP